MRNRQRNWLKPNSDVGLSEATHKHASSHYSTSTLKVVPILPQGPIFISFLGADCQQFLDPHSQLATPNRGQFNRTQNPGGLGVISQTL
jgi:hypothetical protein